MVIEEIVLNKERNVTLTAYIQGCGDEFPQYDKRPGILVVPGGGYQHCSNREADPVAFPYMAAGYQAFILRYSLGEDATWPNPLEDYEQAMELIKSKSDEWMVIADKIAIVGFSAGGHLCAAAATMAKNRPQAVILGYPLTGEDTKNWEKTAPDTVPYVDSNTPPCFIFATKTDATVPVMNSIRFMTALEQAGVQYECHIYSYGKHGLSTDTASVKYDFEPSTPRFKNWVADSIGWLGEVLGDFGPEGFADGR